jgi:hypothetical protein
MDAQAEMDKLVPEVHGLMELEKEMIFTGHPGLFHRIERTEAWNIIVHVEPRFIRNTILTLDKWSRGHSLHETYEFVQHVCGLRPG